MSPSKVRYEWNTIPWRKVKVSVFKLQKRIYRASLRNEVKKVHRLQKLLLSSTNAKLLAVRQVTQDNRGRNTAGIDGVAKLTKKQRIRLVDKMKLDGKSSPVRRIWIPKPGKPEKRPLGIPTITERGKQALVKIALEPEWEAKFEANSYGFRPGRSAHDACEAIYKALCQKAMYVLDADIAGCFDNINHQGLLEKLKTFPLLRKVIKGWLKAGIMENGIFYTSEAGTPQGGVISPLLANIALHGLEEDTKQALVQELKAYQKGKDKRVGDKQALGTMSIIRYADDFIVMHESEEIVVKAKAFIEEWLKKMGLEMKTSKTQIIHSLDQIGDKKPGFDFLGFSVRQFVNKQAKKGYKLLIKPSRQSQKRHCKSIKETLRTLRAAPMEKVIRTLNPIVKGWSRYYVPGVSSKVFSKMDYEMFYKVWQWATHRHPGKSKRWIKRKYFRRLGKANWRFKTEEGKYLAHHSEHPIKRHIKVKGKKSPYDGDWIYWATKLGKSVTIKPRVAKLLKQQEGKCNKCKLWFEAKDLMEVHHQDENRNNNEISNLKLLHGHCHDKVHQKKTTSKVA
jgi:RNA-directed DNA polymerase